MAEELRVDPLDVRAAADHVDVAAGELKGGHAAAQERITAAQTGWIGTSAAALTALAAKWEKDSVGYHTELIGHGEDFRSAAARYVTADSNAAVEIDQAAKALSDRMGL